MLSKHKLSEGTWPTVDRLPQSSWVLIGEGCRQRWDTKVQRVALSYTEVTEIKIMWLHGTCLGPNVGEKFRGNQIKLSFQSWGDSCSLAKRTGHQVEGRMWAKTWKMSRWTQSKKCWQQHLGGRAMGPVESPACQSKNRKRKSERKGLGGQHSGVYKDSTTRWEVHINFWILVN